VTDGADETGLLPAVSAVAGYPKALLTSLHRIIGNEFFVQLNLLIYISIAKRALLRTNLDCFCVSILTVKLEASALRLPRSLLAVARQLGSSNI
jgi:hypothetical protein